MRGIPQSQFDSKPSESGVRSDPDFDPTAPGSQDAIRRAQVRDNLARGRAPKYGDPTHPSKTGTRGSTYTDIMQDRRGVSNPGREKAIQDILANQGRRAEFEAMSDEELRGEIDKQISANNQAQMDRIKADRESEEMKNFGYDASNTSDVEEYRSRAQDYRDKMRDDRIDYSLSNAKAEFDQDVSNLQGQRQSIGYGKGSDRAARYAINRELGARRAQERRERRLQRVSAAGGRTRDQFMRNENYFPTSPSEFVKMLREQSN